MQIPFLTATALRWCSLSASLKDKNLKTSSVEMFGLFLKTSCNLVCIIPVSGLLPFVSAGSSWRSVSASGVQ